MLAMIGCHAPEDTSTADQAVSGSVSDGNPSTTWSAGPFLVPNPTATAGPPLCGAATPCDEYALAVSTPPGYGDTHALRITVQWALGAADFDLYVLDAAGNVIADAASSSDPEVVQLPPTSGSYVVRVIPFAPLGQSYTGTASLVARPANPPPSTEPPATYSAHAAPETAGYAHEAGEPSIGYNAVTGATLFQALHGTYRVTFDDAAATPAASWIDASATLPKCTAGVASLDPILFTDRTTGRTFESQLAGKASLTCFSSDDGASWTPTVETGIDSGVDHQTIGGGPFAPGLIGPLTSYPHAVYYCSQDIAEAQCALSRDGGLTFGLAVPIYSLLDCGGLHGHVKVAPDGTVYVPNKGCNGNQAVVASEDNGTTWQVRRNPASTPGDSDPAIGIGAAGTIYLGYHDSSGAPRAAVSRDKGRTWQHDQNVGAALGIANIVFPAVVAGDDDRAAFAFLGTTTPGNYQDAESFHGVWHLYVATTYDGGLSWVTADATPDDPVQRGSICTGGTTCGEDRNLLDFMDVTIDGRGRVLVGYADGCTGACATGGPQSFDALASIARQRTGRTLYAAYDPFANLAPEVPAAAVAGNGASSLSAVVRNTGNAAAAALTVRFLDNGQLVGDAVPATIAAGASATVTVPWSTRKKHGSRTITVIADPVNQIRELSEADNTSTAVVVLP